MEWLRFGTWKSRLTGRVAGTTVLEVGVGTGKNLPYYPKGIRITAIDFSPGMLARARKTAAKLTADVDLCEMDVQHLIWRVKRSKKSDRLNRSGEKKSSGLTYLIYLLIP